MKEFENDKKPWDKLEQETPKAFHAFNVYLALGANRSHALVAKKTGQKALGNIQSWSKKFNWVKRCEAYDLDFMRKSQSENRLRTNNIYKLLLRLFEMPAVALTRKLIENPEKLNEMSVNALYKLIMEGAKLTPSIAQAQEINSTQFIDDATADMPDDEIAKMLDNSDIKESLDGLLESFQATR